VEANFQGLLLDDLQTTSRRKPGKRGHAPGIVDCWEYEDFKSAVEATGKKEADYGWANQRCLHCLPAISAVEDGYEVQVIVDAVARIPCYQ